MKPTSDPLLPELNATSGEPFAFKSPSRLIDFMREADKLGLINLAAGVPSPALLPTKDLARAFNNALKQNGGEVFAYHHPEGDHELRELIAERLKRRGLKVKPKELVITTGCTQSLQVMLTLVTEPGDVVACEAPAYYGMLELLSYFKVHVLPIPTHLRDGMDLNALQDRIRKYKPKAVVVCSTLSNPCGATIPPNRRKEFVEICRRAGVRIIEDEVYAELHDRGVKPLRAFDDGSTVSYVASFSKSISPGIRVGYAIPGTWFEDFAERKCQQDMHSSVVSEMTMREYIKLPAADRNLEKLRKVFAKRRKIARKAIEETFPEGTLLNEPEGTYMYWAVLPEEVDLRGIQKKLARKKIAFGHGQAFLQKPEEQRMMRLNTAKATEEELDYGLRELGKQICDKRNRV